MNFRLIFPLLVKITFPIVLLVPGTIHAEWLDTKEGCSVEFPDVIDGEIPRGRKSSWTGNCVEGVAMGNGELKINAGAEFKSIFTGMMNNGRFDGLVRYHWKLEKTEKTRDMKSAGKSVNEEKYFHESVIVSEEEYAERITYRSRFENAITLAELERFLFSTTRYDPDNLATEVRKKLTEEKVRKHKISLSVIEQEKESLLKINDFELVFDIDEEEFLLKDKDVNAPFFVVGALAQLQERKMKFRMFSKKNPLWRPRYGSYKVTVQFYIEGVTKSKLDFLSIRYDDSQKFRESGPTVTFLLGESNGWNDIKNVKLNEATSSVVLSTFGKESIRVSMEDIKIMYEINSVEAL